MAACSVNERYLQTKKDKMGHILSLGDPKKPRN